VIRIWVIAGLALLAGCESEFDRCMNTELVNAGERLNMATQETAFNRAVTELKAYQGWVAHMFTDQEIRAWFEKNPIPLMGEEETVSQWFKSERYVEHRQKERKFLLEAAQAYGLGVGSYEEWADLQIHWTRLMKEWIEPRSVTANCESEECFNGNLAEEIAASLDEAVESFDKEIEENQLAIRNAAASACNRNGIYE
jgi:hypothetical protein